MSSRFCRDAAVVALIASAACTDSIPTTPTAATDLRAVASGIVNLNATATVGGEQVVISPALDVMNARLAAARAGVRIAKAELLLDARRWDRRKGMVVLSKDFTRGIGAEWVRGDQRRGGRTGVTYTFGSNGGSAPYVYNQDRTSFVPVPLPEQQKHIERGMDAWRDLRCSNDPSRACPSRRGPTPTS